MADADDIALAEEEVGLAEGHPAVDQLRGAGDDEEGVAVLLELRPLVGVLGVVDREVVQLELALDPGQQLAGRLEQADPDHVAVLAPPVGGLLDGDVGDAVAGEVDAGGDDAGLGGVGAGKVSRIVHSTT